MREANEEVVKKPEMRSIVYSLDKSYIIAGPEGALFLILSVPCSASRFNQLIFFASVAGTKNKTGTRQESHP